MGWQVTFFFESEQAATYGAGAALGWSETWYAARTGSVVPGEGTATIDLMLTHNDITKYIMFRKSILPSIYRCSFVRVSWVESVGDTGSIRQTKIRTILGGVGELADDPPGQVQCALLAQMMRLPAVQTDPVVRRAFLMRALPKSIINGNVLNISGADWSNVERFLNFVGLKASGGAERRGAAFATALGLRYVLPSDVAYTTITDMKPSGNDPHYATIKPVIGGLVRGDVLLVKGTGESSYDRKWTYVDSDGGTPPAMVVGRSRRSLKEVEYVGPGGGKMKKLTHHIGQVSQYAVIGLRTRRTGRVFRQLRGRR